jgi:hypothetical protein
MAKSTSFRIGELGSAAARSEIFGILGVKDTE